jgi:hypothetical protein
MSWFFYYAAAPMGLDGTDVILWCYHLVLMARINFEKRG